ncbi:MAG: DUF433 domain-containing protein [Acidimicrobiaceae bacterium]|nr:DUF433 domain-containing protein [Acidimicrobiaceae bacterium]
MTNSDSPKNQKFITIALRRARGQYGVTRTSQLSGIPSSTLYEWSRNEIYIPDFQGGTPKAWSYRDLVFLRLLAWLRQGGMERVAAAQQVKILKSRISEGFEIQYLYADNHALIYQDEQSDRMTGVSILPFDNIADCFGVFDLLDPIEELNSKHQRLWAPDLQEPSMHTRISPFVMAGDPCISESRVPTASIYALRYERGLEVGEIVELFPGLSSESVIDANDLERRLRRESPIDGIAA